MTTTLNRMLALGAAFFAFLTPGLSTVQAQDAPRRQAAQQSPATFAGDVYLLGTDPVTGQPLGEKPIIHQHEGRELRFADQKSLDAFKAEPAKYLAGIDQQMIQQQLPLYPLDTCVVSGEKLGGDMGKAIDLIHKNRLVRFCCKDCVRGFLKEPGKVIAKLDAAVIARQTASYPLETCVVSGEKLGGMGKPVDWVVGNRLVRFCCSGCIKSFQKNPVKYLKLLDEAGAKKPTAAEQPAATEGEGRKTDHDGHKH